MIRNVLEFVNDCLMVVAIGMAIAALWSIGVKVGAVGLLILCVVGIVRDYKEAENFVKRHR